MLSTRRLVLASTLLLLGAPPAAVSAQTTGPAADTTPIVLPGEGVPAAPVAPAAPSPPAPAPLVPAAPGSTDPAPVPALDPLLRKTNPNAISAEVRLSGPTVRGMRAVLRPDGTAIPPAAAPRAVRRLVWTTNRLIGLRYRYGGGHRSFADSSYDCSGAVSYALRAAALLDAPLVSGQLARWEQPGPGRWVTVYANAGHVYMSVAGLRLDTSAVADPGGRDGPRWRPLPRPAAGFHVRHPRGL